MLDGTGGVWYNLISEVMHMNVELRPVSEADRSLIENLFNLYQNDLSAYCSDFDYLDADGYFDRSACRDVLPFGDGVYGYIITENGKNAGFILMTDGTYALEKCDYSFQELYLVRPARGRGLALAAAHSLLKRGRWCLSVYTDNLPARRFWDRLIALCGKNKRTRPGQNGMTDYFFEVE